MNKFLSGVLLCLAATMSWGAMFPIMGRAMRHIDPFTMIDLRYGIAGIAFCVLLVAREGFGSFDLRASGCCWPGFWGRRDLRGSIF